VVADLVYGTGQTPLARWAEERGARVVDGREVLVRQGARSFAIWTGREPPVEVMRRAVVQATSSTSAQV
jgi:shikimate dehydrogenase